MIEKIFYQSSLPRSGSTLLQNVLMQNQSIYSTPTDGVDGLILNARASFNNNPAIKAQNTQKMRNAFVQFCKAGLYAYYGSMTNRPYILSKSRGYLPHYDLINLLTPEAKMICMIRDLREVVGSMEKNYRKDPTFHDNMFHQEGVSGSSTIKRAQLWMSNNPVGTAVENVHEAILQNKPILFIKYEHFCKHPSTTMQNIYAFLGIPFFEHDFENINQLTFEDDKWHGVYGDHKIRKKLAEVEPKAEKLLGKHTCDWIYENYKWFFEFFKYDYE